MLRKPDPRVAHPGEATKRLKERGPGPGAPKEEFGRMIFEKNLPWGTVLMLSQRRRQVLVEVRGGAGTCEAPCILGKVLDSAFMQARVRLSLVCSFESGFMMTGVEKPGASARKHDLLRSCEVLTHTQCLCTRLWSHYPPLLSWTTSMLEIVAFVMEKNPSREAVSVTMYNKSS